MSQESVRGSPGLTQSRGHVIPNVLFLQLHLEVLVELDPQLN